MTNTEQPVWKQYPDYPFIEANQFGEVRTIDRDVTYKNGRKHHYKGHILKQSVDSSGYMVVGLSVNGKNITLKVHRIVATCFIPNPDNLPQVNHKDNNPKNNTISNLEWCTPQYNIAYREKYGKSAKEFNKIWMKPVFAVNLKTLEVLRFESQREAARQLGLDQGSFYRVLKGQRSQVGGYWLTEDENEITEEKIQEIKNKMYFLGGVVGVDLKTFRVLYFSSQHEAARKLGVFPANINAVLKGRSNKIRGCWFTYADENAIENARAKFGNDVAKEVEKLMNENCN